MFAVAGVTGHVGAVTAQELLAKGERVRALVRNPANAATWSERGADVAVADLADRAGLAEAIRGCAGFFVLLPSEVAADDLEQAQRHIADSIAGAVEDSGMAHVVLLSSVGANLAEGTGPIRWLHYLENRLRETGTTLSAIRSFHFQEKVETVLAAAENEGVYPVLANSADVPTPMIATRDIGVVAAETLLSPPATSEVIDLDGPHYTEREVAEKLGAALSRPLQVVTIPQAGWIDALTDAGLSLPYATALAEMYDADQRGILQATGGRQRRCSTEIDDTIRQVLQAES